MTPTPRQPKGHRCIVGPDGFALAVLVEAADRDEALRAVNERDELVAALERAEKALDSISDIGIERRKGLAEANVRLESVMEVARRARDASRAALARAKAPTP